MSDFEYRELATPGKPTKMTISSLATTSNVGGTHHPAETFTYTPVSPSNKKVICENDRSTAIPSREKLPHNDVHPIVVDDTPTVPSLS